MPRPVALLLAAALALGACADDGGQEVGAGTDVPATSTTDAPGPVVGPTTSTTVPANCQDAADAYVDAARELFEGTPTDERFEETQVRLRQLDIAAQADGCGPAYTEAVCDGLDELARSGVLVIFPILTAECI